tara:strand:+ start:2053 stop:2292 length:240 start_codon:yes stop_codon:yes gene_type:complete
MENKKDIEFKSGIKPDLINKEDIKMWDEKYNELSREDKILLETQEQTRLLRRSSNNMAFLFWLFIISTGLSVLYYVLNS